ncbi:3-hydroxyphenylacetate 6 hydroxylase [Metarhizium album ARSEF 1941]|uniref:3-hydroxyphenylacetate 6 hydroxylase n=1 Tax=Metarhizium album (strain ARSEF 1941) TaxID=1081103 RepID=A0A0B2WK02_METAS|nr:3-hydroxyphenylacetate 6 hydroxylase [Metarhizium album ARSEF 1941]KHN96381.1 3-hydroxyphenylacetate 6 hydroxylase [Metarhizium album ARSEF 1941]
MGFSDGSGLVSASVAKFATTLHKTPSIELPTARILLYVLIGSAICFVLWAKPSAPRKFPGPPAWPVVGNLPSIYRQHAERQFAEWAAVYGDVIQVQFGSLSVVVVNSAAAAKSIFTGSAAALSSRPVFHTFHQLIAGTLGPTIGTAGYGEALKRGRKATASELSKPAVKANLDKIDLETRHLIDELNCYGTEGHSPVQVSKVIKRLTLSLSLGICYGRRMYLGDPLTQEIIHVEDEILRLRSMTDNLQDYISILRCWPFNTYQKAATGLRERRDAYVGRLNREIEEKMREGTHEECLYTKNFDGPHPLPTKELSTVLLTFLSGGLATASNTMHWSLTLLAARPEIQETAYRAIREVYPDNKQLFESVYQDTEEVRYMSALVRECLRYYTPSRLALPRLAVQDIRYQDGTISEGDTVVLNTFACNRDAAVYGDPYSFRPERWLENPDLPIFSYGLGYRMCAGYTLANREMYIVLMRIIACFRISADGDIDADPITGCLDAAHQAMAPKPSGLYFEPRDGRGLKRLLQPHQSLGI